MLSKNPLANRAVNLPGSRLFCGGNDAAMAIVASSLHVAQVHSIVGAKNHVCPSDPFLEFIGDVDQTLADVLGFFARLDKVAHLMAIALGAHRDIQPVTMWIDYERSHSIEPP
jgi:hypothetical protein